jgi:hypothetical protein
MASMADGRKVHKVLVGKFEGKRPFGRPWRRWKDIREIGGGCGVDSIALG